MSEEKSYSGTKYGRRKAMKVTGGALAGLFGLSQSVSACQEHETMRASNWKKDISFRGAESVSMTGGCNYEFAIDADDWNGKIEKYAFTESSDRTWYQEDADFNMQACCGGEVQDGSRDEYRYTYDKDTDPFESFYTAADIDVQITNNMNPNGQWKIRVRGAGSYTIWFASDKEPIPGGNHESDENYGVNSSGQWISGSVDCYSCNDSGDDWWVDGDIKMIKARNVGSNLEVKALSHH